jgi:hypothetical protein
MNSAHMFQLHYVLFRQENELNPMEQKDRAILQPLVQFVQRNLEAR